MLMALLIAGIVFLLAGLAGIALGIPVKEFSFGNTEILAGVIVACTGMIMVSLWITIREFKKVARRVNSAVFFGSSARATANRAGATTSPAGRAPTIAAPGLLGISSPAPS